MVQNTDATESSCILLEHLEESYRGHIISISLTLEYCSSNRSKSVLSPADYDHPSAYTNLTKLMRLNAASTHFMLTFKARTGKTTWHCYAFVGHESRGIKP